MHARFRPDGRAAEATVRWGSAGRILHAV